MKCFMLIEISAKGNSIISVKSDSSILKRHRNKRHLYFHETVVDNFYMKKYQSFWYNLEVLTNSF